MNGTKSFAMRELALPFAAYLLIYSVTLSHVPSIATDSASYINQIDSGENLLHPHHLIYNAVAWAWLAIWRLLGIHTDGAILAAELNAIFGALCLCVFYCIVRSRLGSDRWTAVLATGLPAFSWGFWYYSGCVEVYIIPLFLLLLSFYLLTDEHVDERAFALVGFLNGVAVLFAQISVLFAAVVFLAAWLGSRRGGTSWAKCLANYLLAAVPTVAAPYLWAVSTRAHVNSLRTAWSWLTNYAHYPRYWTPLSRSSVPKAGIGLGQAFVGSHFLFALPGVRHWVERLLHGFYLDNEAFLVRNLGNGMARLLVTLAVVLFLIVMVSLADRLRLWPSLSLKKQQLVYLSAVWFLAYGSFVFFYMSVNAKFWIPPSLCLWIIFLVFLLGTRTNPEVPGRSTKVILAVTVALCFLVNYLGSIRFTRDQANDYYYSEIEPLVELATPDDLIIIGTSWKFEPYVRRYGKGRILSLTSVYETSAGSFESVREVQSAIDDELAAGGKVLVSREATVLEQETIRGYPGITAFQTLWDSYRRRWITKEFQATVVYILEPTKAGSLEPRHETYAATLGK